MSKEVGFERKNNVDGTSNPKYIDVLDEDKPIAGQKFTCISFISPEKILQKKDIYFFKEFLKHWDFTKSVQKFTQFLHFLAFKWDMNFDKLMEDLKEFLNTEQDELVKTTIHDDYKNFLDAKEEDLEKTFNEMNSFQTNTRGIKIRGSYPTQAEAELRCKMLREVDPNHDVYVGPCGIWMPWNPEAYKTGRVEYLEEELNQLMHEKNKNEKQARQEFEKRVVESKRKAIEENKKQAKQSGNKLTQNIDKEGNLVGIAGMSTVESSLHTGGNLSTADIRKELFEGENIRTRSGDKKLTADLSITKKNTEKNDKTSSENVKVSSSKTTKNIQPLNTIVEEIN